MLNYNSNKFSKLLKQNSHSKGLFKFCPDYTNCEALEWDILKTTIKGHFFMTVLTEAEVLHNQWNRSHQPTPHHPPQSNCTKLYDYRPCYANLFQPEIYSRQYQTKQCSQINSVVDGFTSASAGYMVRNPTVRFQKVLKCGNLFKANGVEELLF